MRRMIDRYEDAALRVRRAHRALLRLRLDPVGPRRAFPAAAGAGSDSASPARRVKMRVRSMRGGFSGGTVASLLNVLKEVAADPALREVAAEPVFALPAPARSRACASPTCTFAEYDADFDAWVAPFIMSAINTRVVHRSQRAVGPCLRPRVPLRRGDADRTRRARPPDGHGDGRGSRCLHGGRVAWGRARGAREVRAAAPGEGPSPEQQRKGGFDLRFHGRCANGQVIRARVTGDRDPGYGSTAKMLGAGSRMPRAGHPEITGRRRVLDARHDLWRQAGGAARGPLRREVRAARKIDQRGKDDADDDAIPAAGPGAHRLDAGDVVLDVRHAHTRP